MAAERSTVKWDIRESQHWVSADSTENKSDSHANILPMQSTKKEKYNVQFSIPAEMSWPPQHRAIVLRRRLLCKQKPISPIFVVPFAHLNVVHFQLAFRFSDCHVNKQFTFSVPTTPDTRIWVQIKYAELRSSRLAFICLSKCCLPHTFGEIGWLNRCLSCREC